MKPELNVIGQITTPYQSLEECPNNIQFDGPTCLITLYDEYRDGLLGLTQGQNILIIYWLENTNRSIMHQSFRDDKPIKGTFALRSPHRPNPIGVAVLPIEKLDGDQVTVKGLDCLNGTLLIDIKPAIYQEVQPITSR